MAMESAIVIKVKYEETLRRFNARVINEKLDLNMHGLSDKIFQLFNIARDAELILTYVDEDGDVVTLVDDEDLQDVMRQDLNPLRISVRLNAGERSSRPSSRSSGSSTPLRSPRVQPPFPNLNSSVSDVLKSVPEPLRETVMKFYSDMISSTYLFPNLNSSLSDVLKSVPEPLRETVMKLYSDLISRTYKMGLSYYQNQPSGSQPVKETSFPSGASNGNAMVADGGNSNGKSAAPSIKKNEPHTALNDVGRTAKAIESEFKYVDDALDAWVKLKAKSKALEADRTETAPSSSEGRKAHTLLVNSGEEKDKKYGACPGEKPLAFSYNSASPVPPEKSSGENPSKNHSVAKPVDMGGLASFGKLKQCTWDSCNADSGGSSIKMPTLRLVPVSANECPFPQVPKNASRLVQVPANECPFSGVPNDPVPPPLEVPLKRTHNHSDGAGTIFHRGVRCDGCGVHPITGPRFISKVKENYDLCIICFAEMGNDADYIRMDRPLTYRHPMSFKGLHDLHAAKFRIPTVPQVSRGYGVKPGRPKLDSRFIQDVNILDGTIMAPLTRFTKIWRMRNNGNLAWPQGTQLVWIGGDRLSDRFSVDLEITAGLAVDQELDVAVDFTAPEHPGRYISYWRMALSSGQKFGQRVWVLIQVDASSNLPKKELVHEAFQGLNLNLPPASNDASGSDIINVNPEPQNVFPGPKSSSTTIELVDPVVDVNQNKEQEAIFPTNDSLLVGFGDKSTSPSAPSSSVSYPIIDLSEETPAVTYVAPSAAVDTQAPSQGVRGNNEIEVSLLRELDEMGFKQLDLNKEILRKNEYDLEQSVDDLCGVAEWDPILEELEEMGFSDKEMNKKLLKKNNGSIKRVVMDLIAGEQ